MAPKNVKPSRVPAKNYRNRIRAVCLRTQKISREFVGSENWRPISEEKMEKGLDDFHNVLNILTKIGRARGLVMKYYPGPLTEEELSDLEKRVFRKYLIPQVVGYRVV